MKSTILITLLAAVYAVRPSPSTTSVSHTESHHKRPTVSTFTHKPRPTVSSKTATTTAGP